MKVIFSGCFIKNCCGLLLCLFIGGLLSLVAGQDISSETISHGLYLPFALLNGSLSTDIAAAGPIYSFQNPFLYLPYFMLFKGLNDWPKLSTFLQGIPAGLFFFFAWKICHLAFSPFKRNKNKIFYLCVFLTAATSLALQDQIGRSNGQLWLLSIYTAMIYLFLTHQKSDKFFYFVFFVSGFLLGVSSTALPFCAGIAAAIGYWKYTQDSLHFKDVLFCMFWGLMGLGLWLIWAAFAGLDWKNLYWAFLPQGWLSSPILNRQEAPISWQEWLFLPWERIRFFFPQYRVDIRLLLGTISAIVLGTDYWMRKTKTSWRRYNLFWSFLFLASYIVWLLCLRDNASSLLLEFLAVILVGRFLLTFLKPVSANILMALVLLGLFLQVPLDTPRQGIENKNFYFTPVPALEENSFILTVGPVSGLIPFLPNQAAITAQIWLDPADYSKSEQRKLSRFNDMASGHYSHQFDAKIKDALHAHQGPVYVLARPTELLQQENVWRRYGLRPPEQDQSCQNFSNNNTLTAQKGFVLCPIHKLSSIN